jgi:hypothetical protein
MTADDIYLGYHVYLEKGIFHDDHHPADTSPIQKSLKSLIQDNSNVTGAIPKGQGSNSGKCVRTVMICI